MKEVEIEEISREDILSYVDMLLQQHKFTYDKRISQLLYEFFLRSHKTFNWSKDEFLDKYINFKNNVKKIRFKALEEGTSAELNHSESAIYINKDCLTKLKKDNKIIYNQFIDNFYHECTHATDCQYRYGKKRKDGLKEFDKGVEKNRKGHKNLDTMLNEYANIISAALISSNTGLYDKNISTLPNLDGYSSLHIPGTIFCTAFDIPERKIAELKDKGRVEFDKYFKEKYPYLKTDFIIQSFRDNMNLIYNSVNNEDKQNIIIGHLNMIELGHEIMRQKIVNEFIHKPNKEFTQKTFFNLQKMSALINDIEQTYKIDKSHFARVKEQWSNVFVTWNFYEKFKDNEQTMNEDARATIIDQIIKHNTLDVKTLVSQIGEKEYTTMLEYDVEEIADKYYSHLSKPLNDNTELIEHLQKSFNKPTIKERLENLKNKFKRIEALPIPAPQAKISEKHKDNFMERIQTEIPIPYIKDKKTEKHQEKEETER